MLESRHFVLLALTIGALTVLSGCNRIFGVPDRYLKDLPQRDELSGRWTIDEASIARMKSEQRFYPMSKLSPQDHSIVLRDDGSCSFMTYSPFQFDRNYIVSDGKWELVMEQADGSEGKRAAVKMTLTPSPNNYVVAPFWIARENGELVIWQYIGDPDRVKYADFHKAR